MYWSGGGGGLDILLGNVMEGGGGQKMAKIVLPN